ncbi:diacylglycerol/lipid kinase family protein [Humidisolicoccus flavus]|uniref:diacylglycerol/lipid kinase family protein n=1 Tax=Humidisolicoccus flavus TaxID=3111414 RepID=UPI00324A1E45
MQAAVVFNPVKSDQRALERAVAASAPADWEETLWFETAADDSGKQAILDALAAEVDVILVSGGDGTVRIAASLIARTNVPLTIIPAGTGNLLARNLGVDLVWLKQAVQTAFTGKDRTIDLAKIEVELEDGSRSNHGFAVIAGFGLDAAMIEQTDEDLKKKVGWLAYVQAIQKAFTRLDSVSLSIKVDGATNRRIRVNTLMLGNCGLLQGNMRVLPDARLDDGKLDVAMLHAKNLRGWLQVLRYVIDNSLLFRRELRRRGLMKPPKSIPTLGYFQCKSVDARLSEPRPLQLDGDVIGDIVAFRLTVDPDALLVRVHA